MAEGAPKSEIKNNLKTYIRGSFLYSEDGFDYEEQQKDTKKQEKIVQDMIGLGEIKKEIAEKKSQLKKKSNHKNEKTVLIPIRDTPVEPIPEPVMENQKCERATQEQFEYFQTYISQKEKERKFQEQQHEKIEEFLEKQQLHKQAQEANCQPERVTIVMEPAGGTKPTKKRMLMKIKIRKPNDPQNCEQMTKVRILE